ncbi:MAG: extracellular solute-binding protein [Verrucomicrobia bacterium]|nr:extracellular solute-binding protein [Verrucomicrobiota bacterium]
MMLSRFSLPVFTLGCCLSAAMLFADPGRSEPITVKVFELPYKGGTRPEDLARYRILERFQELHPNINLEPASALQIEGVGMDAAPLMSIAGGTSPDIIYVNFRQSDTYIRQGFLYPLDEYVDNMPREELADRVPPAVMPVIHREGPGGTHYWAMPMGVGAGVMFYRRDLFIAAGLDPNRPPTDWDELRDVARKVADPTRGICGLGFLTGQAASWGVYSYFCSGGVEVVKQLPDSEWRAAFDSPEAVTTFEFIDDLQKEKVTRNGVTGTLAYRGADLYEKWRDGKVAIMFEALRAGYLSNLNPQLIGVAPVPKGPTGRSSSEVNAGMMGLFAGQKDKRVRDAAWEWIRFYDGPEARRIFTQTMVEQGAWRMIDPRWLKAYGFPSLAKLTTPGLLEAFEEALANGTPEPYGKNCQFVYPYLTKPMEQIFFFDFRGMSRAQRRAKIQECLTDAVRETNEKMIGLVPEPVRKKRNAVGWMVVAFAAAGFSLLVRSVFQWTSGVRTFAAEGRAAYKDRLALALIAPALLLILMWAYYPLVRGSLMAFQNYNVMGGSPWVGISNFADVLYDGIFWMSLKNAAVFCALWMLMGFLPPVCLAVILQEIPAGKILFRVLFYLPAVVSGVVILFMWRAIYDPSPAGILNKILGCVGVPAQTWLQDPKLAMFCVVFPMAWANLGPGCIIYLAALKGVPDELYEASDMDGATFFGKLRYIVLPYLKPLLVINAVGAFIGGFKSGDAVLAMTGGGPNFATHVVGYEIWQRSFLYLKFGHGTAMAWILGILLLAFTAYQLRILNKVEFRTANR